MSAAVSFLVKAEMACNCINCDAPIFMTPGTQQRLRRTHSIFYCVDGHAQCWKGKSDLESLRDQVAAKEEELARAKRRIEFERAEAEAANRRASAAKGEVTKMRNRVGNGVCPCCNRSFTNLARHMGTKHPDFKNGDAE